MSQALFTNSSSSLIYNTTFRASPFHPRNTMAEMWQNSSRIRKYTCRLYPMAQMPSNNPLYAVTSLTRFQLAVVVREPYPNHKIFIARETDWFIFCQTFIIAPSNWLHVHILNPYEIGGPSFAFREKKHKKQYSPIKITQNLFLSAWHTFIHTDESKL